MYCKCNDTMRDILVDLCIANEPKTSTFQMRINPQVKAELDKIFAKCGLTITDATNLFWQQTLNAHTLPFLITDGETDISKDQAIMVLLSELEKGRKSTEKGDLISEDEVAREFCVRQ